MSKETYEWLNRNILVGFTSKRGNAWHYRSDLQEGESNHYEDAIPVEDVRRRLFNFTVESTPIYIPGQSDNYVEVPGRAAWYRSDSREVLGVFAESYQGHQYEEWLIDTVALILDDTLQIGGAGLLRKGAQAYVQVEMPDSITTPEGVAFRPHLLATTSFDGTIATTFKKTVTVVVCDNTREAALREGGEQFKVKHTRHSSAKLDNAREALAIVHTMADDFANEVAALCAVTVTDKEWDKFLNELCPVPAEEDNKRGNTVAEKKRDSLTHLYRADERSATWNGTAYGVLQAWNTYNQHETQVRGESTRAIRNMEDVLAGRVGQSDNMAMKALAKVKRVKALIPA